MNNLFSPQKTLAYGIGNPGPGFGVLSGSKSVQVFFIVCLYVLSLEI
jgi:hypothetical protein